MSDTLKLNVWNQALSHLRVSVPISSLTETNSTTADQCRIWDGPSLRTLLKKANWEFAKGEAKLNLYRDLKNVKTGHGLRYLFDLPSDFLELREIYLANNNVLGEEYSPIWNNVSSLYPYKQKIPFQIETVKDSVSGDYRMQVLCSERNIYCDYTRLVTDYSLMSDDFLVLLGLRLAIFIGPTVSEGKSTSLMQELVNKYEMLLSEALRNLAVLKQRRKGPRELTPLEARNF